jgi:hypothetical protein
MVAVKAAMATRTASMEDKVSYRAFMKTMALAEESARGAGPLQGAQGLSSKDEQTTLAIQV